MKRVLIISPCFPPVNSADMHRIRQGLPYFEEFGWEPVIITVDEKFIEAYSLDPLLAHTVPSGTRVYKIGAFDTKWTKKIGLGSLSLRSYFHFRKKGDELLRTGKFDLIYFSTTAFHVMALGPRWKKKFGVPFILDIQDPWRNDFYLDKPRSERPPKFFISYNIDKYLEAYTVPRADGIISVSQAYCDSFLHRYPGLRKDQCKVIAFGASPFDFEVTDKYIGHSDKASFDPDKINVVYIGRGGHDMQFALEIIFGAFAKGLTEQPSFFSKIHFWFFGTSYAPPGTGRQTVKPVADQFKVGGYVTEITDRLPYFESLFLLKKADILLVPGSTDTAYTASKIYPYILARKPLLAVFHRKSSVVDFLKAIRSGKVMVFDHEEKTADSYIDEFLPAFLDVAAHAKEQTPADPALFEPYTAKARTKEQVIFFNDIIISSAAGQY